MSQSCMNDNQENLFPVRVPKPQIINEDGIQCDDAPRHFKISEAERSCKEQRNRENGHTISSFENQHYPEPDAPQCSKGLFKRSFDSDFANGVPQALFKSVVQCVNRGSQEFSSASEAIIDTLHSSQKNYETEPVKDSEKDSDPLLKFAAAVFKRVGFEDMRSRVTDISSALQEKMQPKFNINEIIEGVVLVGRWNTETNEIDAVGTGFVVDKSNGLIVTAAHVFYDLYFGKTGKRQFGTPIIGIHSKKCKRAVFTYCADIQAIDISRADACILRLTQKFEKPMELNGKKFKRPQNAIDLTSCKKENLQNLTFTRKCELLKDFSLIAFNQSGEDIYLNPIHHVNHYVSVYKGYVTRVMNKNYTTRKTKTFLPKSEIAIHCVTYDGCSGGPCVDINNGKVIGMLSRTDRNNQEISYVVPSGELKRLIKLC